MKIKSPSLSVLSLAGILAFSGTSVAQTIGYDPFAIGAAPENGEYTLGNLVGQDTTIASWAGIWDEAFVAPSAQVVGTGLGYSNGSGTVASTGGSVNLLGTPASRDSRILTTGFNNAFVGTVYMSFMIQLEDVDNSYRAFELHQNTANDGDRKFQIGTGEQGSANFFVRLFNENNFGFFADLGTSNTDVNFFVAKWVFGDTNDADSLTLWMNPEDLASEDGSVPDYFKNNFNMEFNRTTFAAFGSGGATWDEMRLGNTFADVTTVPEPQTYAMLVMFGALAFLHRVRHRKA
jgi:hypothetical protein